MKKYAGGQQVERQMEELVVATEFPSVVVTFIALDAFAKFIPITKSTI